MTSNSSHKVAIPLIRQDRCRMSNTSLLTFSNLDKEARTGSGSKARGVAIVSLNFRVCAFGNTTLLEIREMMDSVWSISKSDHIWDKVIDFTYLKLSDGLLRR